MAKRNINFSSPKIGMNKEDHPTTLKETDYAHAKNSRLSNDDGNYYMFQSEPSNIFSVKIKEGYKVIKTHYDYHTNTTYYFLVKEEGEEIISEIGRVKNEAHVGLSQSEEEQLIFPYETLLNDGCTPENDRCLNFSSLNPIKYVVVKNEKTGTVLYFTDGVNPPRKLEVDRLDQYKYDGEVVCGDESGIEEVCVSCYKMRIFKLFDVPEISVNSIANGGRLTEGTYEYLIAYCDKQGKELSRYFSITLPVHIMGPIVKRGEEEDFQTNYAIKLDIKDLDESYGYYKLIIIHTTSKSGSITYTKTEARPITLNTYTHSQNFTGETASVEDTVEEPVRVETLKSLTSANDFLIGNGIKYEKEINLQPVINLLGSFLMWQSSMATEDLYKDGANSSKYKQYMRDETYPLGIQLILDGTYSSIYPFIGRPPSPEDKGPLPHNKDTEFLEDEITSCEKNEFTEKWQIYNTAEELGTTEISEDVKTNTVVEDVTKVTFVEDKFYVSIEVTGRLGLTEIEIYSGDERAQTYIMSTEASENKVAEEFYNLFKTDIESRYSVEVNLYENNILISGDLQNRVSVRGKRVEEDLTVTIESFSFLKKLDREGEEHNFSIDIDTEEEEYIDFLTYFENNKETICSMCITNPSYSDLCELCDFINIDNYEEFRNIPDLENCEDPYLSQDGTEAEIVATLGENEELIEGEFPEDYSRLTSPKDCTTYRASNETDLMFEIDTDFTRFYGIYSYSTERKVFVSGYPLRDYYADKEDCKSPEELVKFAPNMTYAPTFFHNYYGSLGDLENATTEDSGSRIEELQLENKNATELVVASSDHILTNVPGEEWLFFTNKLHKGALWFKKNILSSETKSVIDISRSQGLSSGQRSSQKYKTDVGNDGDEAGRIQDLTGDVTVHYAFAGSPTNYRYFNTTLRVSIYENCAQQDPVASFFVDSEEGDLILSEKIIDEETGNYSIRFTRANDPENPIFTSSLNLRSVLIAIDVPIGLAFGALNDEDYSSQTKRYKTVPVAGCFSVVEKDIKYVRADVRFKDLISRKKETYETTCEFEVPVLAGCDVIPYKYGKFAYTQSEEIYPDNEELYNSSRLRIKPEDLPNKELYTKDGITHSVRSFFEDTFVFGQTEEGDYIWKEKEGKPITDFRCEPIRHFRFPDNKISPFMLGTRSASFSDTVIHPLGMKLDEDVFEAFLDIAVKNKILTKQQREKIKGYEIVRGDRTGNESIVARGITFDMRKYLEDKKEIAYSSYPFNDLGIDKLNYASNQNTSFIQHPYMGAKNDKWTFSSPETDYGRGSSASYMTIDGFMYGKSKGQFNTVREHAEWVMLGEKSRKLADRLAKIEIATEMGIKIAEMTSRQQFGFVFSLGLVGTIIVAVLEAAVSIAFKYARYRYQWIETFKNLGSPKNFAYYYTAEGKYNYFKPNTEEGNKFRMLTTSRRIPSSRFFLVDNLKGEEIEINNTKREETIFLSSGHYPVEYPIEYTTYDNSVMDFNSSSLTISKESNACEEGLSRVITKNVASMYVTLKNYLPSQYGTIGNVTWKPTGYRRKIGTEKGDEIIFGGDTFITRHTLRRTMPLFNPSGMDVKLGDLTPFDYKINSNIGENPRFYVNYEITGEERFKGLSLPDIKSEYKLDCINERGSYISPPSRMYLYYNGIPNFLVETTINTWRREAEPEPHRNFYPNVGDMMEWTQESINSIRRGNFFKYSNTFSKDSEAISSKVLSSDFSEETNKIVHNLPNGVMWSHPDKSENSLHDPWLSFRLGDMMEFSTSKFGNLYDLKGIETGQVVARFDKSVTILNPIDTFINSHTENRLTDSGRLFSGDSRNFSLTDLGYGGTSNYPLLSTEFGHFYVDAPKGQVFRIIPGGKDIEEVSSFSGKESTKMGKWFKKHLPFKILEDFPNADTDNPYNGVGIEMGYDSKNKRVFLTKKDYKCVKPICVEFIKGKGFYDRCEDKVIRLDDKEYFKEVSFTISYDAVANKWVSFFDFKPNFYISFSDFFQTGKNTIDGTRGVWSHLKTNKSYQTFYNEKFPWEVEIPIVNKNVNKYLERVSYRLDSYKYFNEHDYHDNKLLGFDRAIIYNSTNNSGILELKLQETVSEIAKYPQTTSMLSQKILQTMQDEEFRFNHFFNRVKDSREALPIWNYDSNEIDKKLNTDKITFTGKRILERLRGRQFLLNLQSDDTEHLKMFKLATIKENQYQ